MEPSKEAIAVRITRLNRQILGKVTGGTTKFNKKTIDREALLDALTVLYDECNDDPVKKSDDLVKAFLDQYRSTLAELRRTRVCISDFEMLQTIGRGHFGEVYMVREKQTSDVYALKTLRKEQARKRADDERDVLAASTGPWIPKLQYAFQDTNNLYLVMELCCGGDLAGLLSRRAHPLPEREAAFYIAEITHALKALHGMGYVHRDVKPHNILLDRCGHVKLGDFGSSARLSEGGCAGAGAAPATADYMAPELLAAADCAAHTVCLQYCARLVTSAISSCDYWSLGVIAFELVTLRRPFSSGDEDSIVQILSNIQSYERSATPRLPWGGVEAGVGGVGGGVPSGSWRALVAGLLRVVPGQRYSYLDTLQHAALAHLPAHNIRDQAPPWVPCIRGAEDSSFFSVPPRGPQAPNAAPFRTRPPFAGQLPFVGYSYVAQDDSEDHSGGFNASHDCTAIDLATFKSAEKLAAMRSREISSLQTKLAEAEALASANLERVRHEAEAEAERQRVRLQAEITALSLQNKRLERQVEVEREERMALQRTNQELSAGVSERQAADVRCARAAAAALQAERDALRQHMHSLEQRVQQLQADCNRAVADADSARAQQQHYKDIIEHVHELRHRRLTEINVRPIDSIAKERAIRRQTLSGGEAESREAATRIAAAEANAARELRARQALEKRIAQLEEENHTLKDEADEASRNLASTQERLGEKQRMATTASEQIKELQVQLAQERVKASTFLAQVQELERSVEESVRREAALEEQCSRTEARLNERLHDAEQRAASALHDDARHRDKVNTLEQLVRHLEREVSALEKRSCGACAAAASTSAQPESERPAPEHERSVTEHERSVTEHERTAPSQAGPAPEQARPTPERVRSAPEPASARSDARSDTESVGDSQTQAQLALLKEQLERAEVQLQARAEEMATLRQEARAANLARWRKEREFNELSVESKSIARDLKRAEERLTNAIEARKTAEQKAGELTTELAKLRPQYEQANEELGRLKTQFDKLTKTHEVVQAEVDRSRNDIRKLKSELQYSEKRRLHAEEQEELSSRERSQLRDELQEVRRHNTDLVQNNKALQEACGMLEEQLTDLEKLADIHELKNKDLEDQLKSVRKELESCRARLSSAEAHASERGAAASRAALQHDEARDQARHAHCELQLLRERLEARETRVAELEARAAALESERASGDAALTSAARRVRELQEECASLRTRAHHHHAHALQLQASLADVQEELCAAREAAEAASAWWRTRETKADATLRQQAKLIDFLQAKVEEAGRKKCSLSNKLFGRSGRRPAASPPLRRANRELREEVERLRAKLAACTAVGDLSYPSTPRRERPKPVVNGSKKSIDLPDGSQDKGLLIVWSDGSRERMRAKCVDEVMVLTNGKRELHGRLVSADAKNLPHNEANRAFVIKLESTDNGSEVAVVCGNISERTQFLSRLRNAAPAPPGYAPTLLAPLTSEPHTAIYVAPNAVAIGCAEGLQSLRGPVHIEWEGAGGGAGQGGVAQAQVAGGRALLAAGGALAHAGLLALGSALRRAASLQPALTLQIVHLPDAAPPHLIKAVIGDSLEGPCAAVACGRRVFLLRYDASTSEFKIARSLTVDRPPNSLLLTTKTLFIAGEKPLKINLPSSALETFGMDEPTIATAAKKHSPPQAFLLIKENPVEILLCYAECGVFIDENGKRTRNEDPKWSTAVYSWEFVKPFLYVIGDDKVTIVYLNDDAYKAPPCTCDATSLASTASDCYLPEIYTLKLKEPVLLGTAPNGIIIRSKGDDVYNVSIIEGMTAFRSVGASVESLATISDTKGSTTDLAQSLTDITPQDVSQESVEVTTGFLADIRKRARQLRNKHRKEQTPDDVIKEILTTEVELKRTSNGRKSPATISEFDSDSDTDESEKSDIPKGPADLCAEMFTRQVRFQ